MPALFTRTDSGRPGRILIDARQNRVDLALVGDVEYHRLDVVRGKRFAVRSLADSGQHVPPALGEQLRGLASHSRAGAGDDGELVLNSHSDASRDSWRARQERRLSGARVSAPSVCSADGPPAQLRCGSSAISVNVVNLT